MLRYPQKVQRYCYFDVLTVFICLIEVNVFHKCAEKKYVVCLFEKVPKDQQNVRKCSQQYTRIRSNVKKRGENKVNKYYAINWRARLCKQQRNNFPDMLTCFCSFHINTSWRRCYYLYANYWTKHRQTLESIKITSNNYDSWSNIIMNYPFPSTGGKTKING